MNTAASAIGVFLHFPDNREPIPLPDVANGHEENLQQGVHAIAASGSGNVEGTAVTFEIATDQNSITRKRRVRADGTLRAWITFEIDTAGKVS